MIEALKEAKKILKEAYDDEDKSELLQSRQSFLASIWRNWTTVIPPRWAFEISQTYWVDQAEEI